MHVAADDAARMLDGDPLACVRARVLGRDDLAGADSKDGSADGSMEVKTLMGLTVSSVASI